MPALSNDPKRIIIVGGGFGGIETALSLSRRKLADIKITLISSSPHFEYTPALHRVVGGVSPLEVCIPLKDIFEEKNIEIIRDTVVDVDIPGKSIKGVSGSAYTFDYCVLALGSEVTYFDIPGLKECSFGFKSIHEALRLKRHLHEIFDSCKEGTSEEKVCACHVLVVGAGATGVELAGELSVYLRRLARQHNFPPEFITLDLIEAAPRILPTLKEDMSREVAHRLRSLGVNIFVNRSLVKEEIETVFLKDMQMRTKTLIWAAGIKAHHLYNEIQGLTCDKKGRVIVDEFLRAQETETTLGLAHSDGVQGKPEEQSKLYIKSTASSTAGFDEEIRRMRKPCIYVIGDGASTPYAGMAQTALRDARYAANNIIANLSGRKMSAYRPFAASQIMPVGEGWAAALIGHWRFYGKLAWWLRRIVDLRYFLSILPLRKALMAFREGTSLCESCEVCSEKS